MLRLMLLLAMLMFTIPLSVAAEPTIKLWPKGTISGQCASHSRVYGVEQMNQNVFGHKWPHVKGGGIEFIDHSVALLNAAARGRDVAPGIKARLLVAAKSGAFTKPDWEDAGGSSPSFVSAVIVKTVAYSVAYLRLENALTAVEEKEIQAWTKKLSSNMKKRANSKDHKAANIVAQMLWAAAIDDKSGFSKAYKSYSSFLGALRSKPYFSNDVRNNNEVMHHLVLGAAVLRMNGIEIAQKKVGKHSFDDAIAYHAQRVIENGTNKVKTSGDPKDDARSIFRAEGWGTHLAWIPIYKSVSKSTAGGVKTRELERALRRADGRAFWGIQIGIHSGCMFGRS